MVRANDLHRVYIQTLLARRAMTADVALEMYKRAVAAVRTNDREFEPEHRQNTEGLRAFVEEIGTLLETLGMGPKWGHDEVSGRPWLILRNIEGGDVAQQATDLTPLEISFFRALIEAIMGEYPGYSVGSVAAYNLVSGLSGTMKRSDAEDLLDALVSRNWLLKSKRGRFSLAPRALVELDHYLRETYPDDILTCRRCERLLTTGIRCATDDCQAGYHVYCWDRLRGMRGACMECKQPFANADPTPVGERAVPRNEDQFRNANRKRKRNGAVESVAESEENGAESDGDGEDTFTQTQNQSASASASQSQSQSQSRSVTQEPGPSRRRSRRHQETIIPDSMEV